MRTREMPESGDEVGVERGPRLALEGDLGRVVPEDEPLLGAITEHGQRPSGRVEQ